MRRLVVLLAAALLFVAGWSYAQVTREIIPVNPTVLSGADIGFRVEGRRGETAVGTLVVRVNGQWIEADPNAPTLRRSTE